MKKPLHIINPDAKEIIEDMSMPSVQGTKILADGIKMEFWEPLEFGFINQLTEKILSAKEFEKHSESFVYNSKFKWGIIAFLKDDKIKA